MNGDVGALRPYIGDDGRTYVTVNENGKPKAVPLNNANATLRKDDWKILDRAVVKAAVPRVRQVADLRAAGLEYTIPNGLGKTVLETEAMSGTLAAETSMDGLKQSQADRPEFSPEALPVPITHVDFHFSARQVMASRSGGSPLDTDMAE